MDKGKNLKIFFIKLISITVAIIIIINVFFNLVVSNVGFIDKLTSLSELDNRREQADKIRSDLNDLLKKDNLINKEDRILLYNLYKKLKSEFEEIK
tara:strand:- start:1826 stop:2113 length:288 start_codon:yes stop_codon:yes gene_type:complete